MNRNSHNTSGAVTDKPEQALSCAAREVIMRKCPALFPLCLCASVAMLLFSGCVAARKKGRTIHERFDYQVVQSPGFAPAALMTCHEIWRDEWTGGGRAFLADPKASELMSAHKNQTALGGSSSLSIGSLQSEVSTNGISAVGEAGGNLIEKGGAAAGQFFNKAVTGKP